MSFSGPYRASISVVPRQTSFSVHIRSLIETLKQWSLINLLEEFVRKRQERGELV